MYLSDDIKKELDYFKRLHEHYSIQAGEKQISVKNADEKILYILMSASYAMDIFEEGFFENFVLTDKALTNSKNFYWMLTPLLKPIQAKRSICIFFSISCLRIKITERLRLK